MASSTSAHFQLLKKTTEVKLHELTKHECKLDEHYRTLLKDMAFDSALPSATRRQHLETLYNGVKDLQVVQTNVHTNLEGIEELVEFASADPWTTSRVLQERTEHILREVRQKRALWRHNKLLGALLMASLDEVEQAQSRKEATAAAANDAGRASDDAGSDFVAVEDAGPLMGFTKDETQARLESFFFHTPDDVTEESVHAFLETHVFAPRASFSKGKTRRVQRALSSARAALLAFGESFRRASVSKYDVFACVRAMLSNKGGFSDDVVTFLTDVKSSDDLQVELAHVLTIQLSNLDEFAWPASGVSVEIKRGMNGRFRCHLKEEVLTALLFHYVGTVWAAELKRVGNTLLKALESDDGVLAGSVADIRKSLVNKFRLSALPSSLLSIQRPYDETGNESNENDGASEPINKQDIVRLVCTEAHLVHALEAPDAAATSSAKGVTAVTTDLEFFGPSVSHDAAIATLRFLGVPDDVLAIFRTYMEIPLVFPGCDAPTRMCRGLSVGRVMTLFLSEVLLLVLDYHVLATTDLALYRKHDDIWFFHADEATAERAWCEMNRVTSALGLRFNADKSGSQRVVVSASSDAAAAAAPSESASEAQPLSPTELPRKPIQWGLLKLQPNGSVKIARDLVTAFATEMADRMRAAQTVFAWINVYNKYMRFFLRNLGGASPVFGLDAVDDILATLTAVHEQVFVDTNGDVLACLQAKIRAEHPEFAAATTTAGDGEEALSLPAAWVHWPLELGGLGLFNPFLSIWPLKAPMYQHLRSYHSPPDKVWPKEKKLWTWQAPFTTTVAAAVREPFELFAEAVARDGVKDAKSTALERFLYLKTPNVRDARRWGTYCDKDLEVDDSYSLRTFDEYVAVLLRTQQTALSTEFQALLSEVAANMPNVPWATTAYNSVQADFNAADLRDAYTHWVGYLYAEQLLEAFGTVAFFSRELLPAQLIRTIKTTAVSW